MGNWLPCCLPRSGSQEKGKYASAEDGQARAQRQNTKVFKGTPDDQRMLETWRKTGIVGLRDRGLKELPACVALVGGEAKVLDATNNRLSAFPLQLQPFTNLQKLTLASNSIGQLSACALAPLAFTLKLLVLDDNMISQLPDEIGSLVRLEKLSLKNNQLTELNPCVGQLKLLQFLVVSHNKLEELPSALQGCENLEELDASDNLLTCMPASLSKLQRLKTLKLDNNAISEVPSLIFLSCGALQTLALHGNPIVPDSIQETEGFQVFEQRRRQKYNKVIAGGVLMGPRGLDEGVDRKTTKDV